MNNIEVKDNLLSSFDFKNIQEMMCGGEFPWFLCLKVVYPHMFNVNCNELDNYQLCHIFMRQRDADSFPIRSDLIELLTPIVKHMNVDGWIRIKANLNPRTSSIIKHGFHADDEDKRVKASIFYVNSNDGYTEFEDGTRIESVANRLVTFPAYLPHTGTTCTDQSVRIVINFNYF